MLVMNGKIIGADQASGDALRFDIPKKKRRKGRKEKR